MLGERMLRKVKILFNWLSGYRFSDPRRNGEYRFLRRYLKNGMVVFDVGANIGEYTAYMLGVAPELEVHCFETVAETFALLQQRHGDNSQVYLNNFGLSDVQDIRRMKIYGETYGINSLYERRSSIAAQPEYANYLNLAQISDSSITGQESGKGVDECSR
jgi:FkbM family methyltransferase